MSNFKRLNTKFYKKGETVKTSDYIYWKEFKPPVLVKEFGPIDYIHFSPVDPFYFAVSCSVRVQVYNPVTKLVVKNFSRFREAAYGAVFKPDGRLLCVGGEEKNVKLFDVSTKSLLRLFKGHSAAVHRVNFISNQPLIASYSDDKCIKVWDIPTEKNIITFNDHTDYIRAGTTNPVVNDIILSGGYDGIIKMYDLRTDKSILTVEHGSPVESLLFMPSGGMFFSAGGSEIKIWDTLIGGKLLGSLSRHHKTITCLHLAANNKRLLSGSLDRHIKIYDINTFEEVHTLAYPNAILSLGVSKNDDTLAVGLVDGLVCISRKEEIQTKPTKTVKKASYRYKSYTHFDNTDLVIKPEVKEKETKYDKCIRKFMFSKALDQVLLPYVANKTPEVTVCVIQELIRRKVLENALRGREVKSISQFLRFIHRNIVNCQFTRVLVEAFNIFLDVYEDKIIDMPEKVCTILLEINKLLEQELELLNQLSSLQGSMSMILAATTCTADESITAKKVDSLNLKASIDAQKNFVIKVT